MRHGLRDNGFTADLFGSRPSRGQAVGPAWAFSARTSSPSDPTFMLSPGSAVALAPLRTRVDRRWLRRFLERLANGPLDRRRRRHGGAHLRRRAAAALPRGGEPARARGVVSLHVSFINAGAELIETNTFGANRPKLATHFLEDELERINSTAVELAREARETTGRDVFIAGSIGPLGDVELAATARADSSPSRRRSSRAAAPTCSWSRRSTTSTSSRTRSRPCAASRRLPIVALMTFDEDARDARRRHGRRGGATARELDVAAMGANHGAGLLAALHALDRDGRRRPAARRAAEHRPRQPRGQPGHLPARHARVLRASSPHTRGASARGIIGGCCGTTPAEIAAIRTRSTQEREPALPLVPASQLDFAAAPPRSSRRSCARMRSRASSSSRSSSTRPSAADAGAPPRDRPRAEGVRARRTSSTSTTTHRPRGHERADGLGRDRAGLRDRDRSRT